MAHITRHIGLSSGEIITFYISDHEKYLDVDYYEIDEIVSTIKKGKLAPKNRIFVLGPDETILYMIPEEDIATGGSYSENYQDGQRRSLSFTLYNEDGKYYPSINVLWAGTKIRFEQGYELNSGDIIWFYKGVYIINQISATKNTDKQMVQVAAKDKFSLFEGTTGLLDSTYEVPVGEDIEEIIKNILLHDTKNGIPLDPKPIIYHEQFKNKKTQAVIVKNAGETYGSLLLELATQLSAEIFYNSMGNLTLIPTTVSTADTNKTMIYEFQSNEGDILDLDLNFNMDEVINQVVIVSSSNGVIHKAVATNLDARSPLCAQRIGVRTAQIINDNNIATDLLAQERADYELRKQLILKSTLSMNVIYNPLLNVNNIVAVSDDDYNLDHERFLLQGITCSLDYNGQMKITVSNLRNLLGDDYRLTLKGGQ